MSTRTPSISNDMRRRPLDFGRSGPDINFLPRHGQMRGPDTSKWPWREIMQRFLGYSFAILAGLYAASFVSERASGQVPPGAGRDLYVANCSACHQAGGEGLPGLFPPLKGSGVVNKDDPTKHIQVVLNGMQGARASGVVYSAAMPAFAASFSDAEIVDIINFERSSWGNHGLPVTAAQIAAERAAK
jgi:cytochrome c oxidase cbb3-type subunit II